jgi:hypothetical protein
MANPNTDRQTYTSAKERQKKRTAENKRREKSGSGAVGKASDILRANRARKRRLLEEL